MLHYDRHPLPEGNLFARRLLASINYDGQIRLKWWDFHHCSPELREELGRFIGSIMSTNLGLISEVFATHSEGARLWFQEE